MQVWLTIHTVEGRREVHFTGERITLGRAGADVTINDSSLSRIHASINRDGDRVWVNDEGSTNGTLVNDIAVASSGTPLKDGDQIDLGSTTVFINFKADDQPEMFVGASAAPITATRNNLPVKVIAAAAVVVILVAVIVIGLASRNGSTEKLTVKRYGTPNENGSTPSTSANDPSPEPSSLPSPATSLDANTDSSPSASPVVSAKRYNAMSPDEQKQFVASEAQHVARMIGNREGYAFTSEVVAKIKVQVDAYARRLNSPKPSGSGCNMHHDLTTLLSRARTYAPVVVRSFNEKGLSPQVGLYLAMIEAEFCPCLSSGTGPKGYFQFASSTARRYGVQDVSSPKDTRPDDRCKIEIMAPIAAQYMKDLIAMFGTGPLSVPLAVASYNSGEGGLNENLKKALDAARTSDDPERSFWTLVSHEEMLSVQFQRENIKYVPKFFGAAIVGENPRVFGVDLLPLSSYAEQRQTASPGT